MADTVFITGTTNACNFGGRKRRVMLLSPALLCIIRINNDSVL